MTKKKSVTKLDVKDTKNATKYVLTHQEQDSKDELVTKLIKVGMNAFSVKETSFVIHSGIHTSLTDAVCLRFSASSKSLFVGAGV